MNNGLKNPNVEALAIDPQMPGTVYAGTFEGIVYKSIDEGEHWRPMSDGLPNLGGNYYMPLVIDPQMPSAIYAGTGGVYKSLNGGKLESDEQWFDLFRQQYPGRYCFGH